MYPIFWGGINPKDLQRREWGTIRRFNLTVAKSNSVYFSALLQDFATSLNLNASNFLTRRDKRVINPIFELLSSKAFQIS